MAVVLQYVDHNGHIIKRFLGIQHVSDTTANSLKATIETLFSKHGLSILSRPESRVRDRQRRGGAGRTPRPR